MNKLRKTPALSFAPFLEELKSYRFSFLYSDILAGLSVSLLAIPQAVAYSLLAGLPVSAGIFSAIFATILASFWGGSRYLISGPSTGIAILLQTSMQEILFTYFPQLPEGEKAALTLTILLHMTCLIGSIQLAFSFFNIAKVLQFISKPVILGYFAGVAVAVIVGQMFACCGVPSPPSDLTTIEKVIFFLTHLQRVDWGQLLIGGASFAFLIFLRKSKFPQALSMLLCMSLLGAVFPYFFPGEIRTLGTEHLFLSAPSLTWPAVSFYWIDKLIFPAFAIALLGILEVFSVSRAVCGKSGDFVNANQEVLSIGLANCFLSFFRGVLPGSASISRTMFNYSSGAKTRFSGIFAGLGVAFFFYVGLPLLTYIPMAAIAALLIFSAFYFLDRKQLRFCLKSTREDALVFFLTFLFCFIFTLDTAFFLGIVISIASYLRKAAEPKYVEYAFNQSGHLSLLHLEEKTHRKVRILGIGGELFFAGVDSLENTLRKVAKDPHTRVIILRMNGVRNMDASLCLALLRIHDYLKKEKKRLLFSGLTPQVWKVFYQSSLMQRMGKENFFLADEGRPQLSTWKACLYAQEWMGETFPF